MEECAETIMRSGRTARSATSADIAHDRLTGRLPRRHESYPGKFQLPLIQKGEHFSYAGNELKLGRKWRKVLITQSANWCAALRDAFAEISIYNFGLLPQYRNIKSAVLEIYAHCFCR